MSPGIADGQPDALDLLTAYQHSAVVAAATLTGVADAMAAGESDSVALASTLSLDPRAVRALLGSMVALGLAEAKGEGHVLSETGAPLATDHPRSISAIVGKEWFFYKVWGELPEAMVDGHARVDPWQMRLGDDPEQALGFLRALDDLADLFGDELPGLSGITEGGTLLDVGGASGSHSAYLISAVDGIEATVLDLPKIGVLVEERHPEVAFVAGDLDQARFGLAEGQQWDIVLLANILHDYPPAKCRELLANAFELVRPGGRVVLYEWVLDDNRDEPPAVALFALMMMVENEGGNSYTESELRGWLEEAGFEGVELRRGFGPIAGVSAVRPE